MIDNLAALANNVCLNNMSAVNPRKVLNSAAGTIKSRLSKWIIDIVLYYPKVLDRPKYCCSECGGTNIQVQAWISPNTGQIIDTLEGNDCWREDCEDRTKLKQI